MGRRHELGLLEGLWPEAARGARQVLLVGGDPGAGKSRLAAEVALVLQRNGASVLVGSCTSDAGLPFDPLVEPVLTLLPALDDGHLVLEDSDGRAEEARDLLRLLTLGSTLGSGPVEGAAGPVVFEVVVSALEAACRVRPLVLVLEDLHWAGESALRGVRYVIERTTDLPALFILTHRTSPADRSTPLSQFLSGVIPLDGVHHVDLAGLEVEEVAQYIAEADEPPTDKLRQAATVLHERTGGNPFVLRELWRDLQQHGGVASLLRDGRVGPGVLACGDRRAPRLPDGSTARPAVHRRRDRGRLRLRPRQCRRRGWRS